MLRSLVLTRTPAFPPLGGAALRNWQNISGLAQLGPVTAVSVNRAAKPGERLGQVRLLSFAIPEPLNTVRKALLRAPHAIARHSDALAWPARRAQLARLKSEFNPHLVVVAELAWAPAIDEVRQWKIPIVYDAHNVETKRFREMPEAGLRSGKRRSRAASEAERAITSAAAQIWTCSEMDREDMAEAYGNRQRIAVIPNGVDSTLYHMSLPEPDVLKRSSIKLLYTGDFGYPPNTIAAERLCERLLPEMRRRLGSVTLCLAGSNPTKSMLEHAVRDPGIVVTGRVPDIRPYFGNSQCLLVPLESGGGTRLKILEAFAAGCPVVSTPKGAEGLSAEAGTHVLVGTTDADLVQRTVEICTRPELAARLTDNARRLVAAKYDWSVIHREIAQAVAGLGHDIPTVEPERLEA